MWQLGQCCLKIFLCYQDLIRDYLILSQMIETLGGLDYLLNLNNITSFGTIVSLSSLMYIPYCMPHAISIFSGFSCNPRFGVLHPVYLCRRLLSAMANSLRAMKCDQMSRFLESSGRGPETNDGNCVG